MNKQELVNEIAVMRNKGYTWDQVTAEIQSKGCRQIDGRVYSATALFDAYHAAFPGKKRIYAKVNKAGETPVKEANKSQASMENQLVLVKLALYSNEPRSRKIDLIRAALEV